MWDQINQVLIYTKLWIKMTTKSIIIIGAGLAGLSTDCYSQMNGYQTHIFEHHTMPGGVATCWKRKGYIIDGGIHFLMCHKSGQSISEIINAQIKKTLPSLLNFYMAGQWATPGGGVISSLYSGRHVVQILCHRDGKPFSIVLP